MSLGLGMGLGMGQNVAAVSGGGGGAWSPASLGANLVLDMTDLSMAKLYTDTGATTNVTADGQTVKAIKDSTGRVWTNSTGWVYHTGSGKPYLVMDNATGFFSNTSVPFADASGQFGTWFSAGLSSTTTNFLLSGNGHGQMVNANPTSGGLDIKVPPATGSTSLATDFSLGVTTGAGQVYGGIILGNGATGTVESLRDNTSNGTTAWSGTPATADLLFIGNTAGGNFYGMFIANGDQSANKTNAYTYMAALHP